MYKTPSIRARASPCQGGCRICGLSELFGAMQSHRVSTRLFTRIASAKTEKPYPMTCAYHICVPVSPRRLLPLTACCVEKTNGNEPNPHRRFKGCKSNCAG